jgi:hypothetical protein
MVLSSAQIRHPANTATTILIEPAYQDAFIGMIHQVHVVLPSDEVSVSCSPASLVAAPHAASCCALDAVGPDTRRSRLACCASKSPSRLPQSAISAQLRVSPWCELLALVRSAQMRREI